MRVKVGRARDSGNKGYFSMPYKRWRLIYVKLRRDNQRDLARFQLYQIYPVCKHATQQQGARVGR
jgi:hypothetical protein